jgi:hypothetical protein
MNDETTQKQAWQTPEIVDLDVDKNTGGPSAAGKEVTASGPS